MLGVGCHPGIEPVQGLLRWSISTNGCFGDCFLQLRIRFLRLVSPGLCIRSEEQAWLPHLEDFPGDPNTVKLAFFSAGRAEGRGTGIRHTSAWAGFLTSSAHLKHAQSLFRRLCASFRPGRNRRSASNLLEPPRGRFSSSGSATAHW